MDIIIVILVVLNAAMIIAVAENYNDENRTYNTRWFMNLYKNDEYGRAVDYASRDKIVIDNIQDNELDESIAVAEYYNAEFYKNVYKTMGNTQKLKQMEEQSDMALKRMGSRICLPLLHPICGCNGITCTPVHGKLERSL